MKSALCALAILTALGTTTASADSFSKGTFTFGLGVHNVNPKDDNGTLAGGEVHIGDSTRPTLTAEYFLADNLGVELLAAVPFRHSVAIDGLGTVAKTSVLPPTLSVQYHFPTNSRFTPFLGAGVNWTLAYDEKAQGALSGNKVRVGNSVGVAVHAGFDYRVSDNGFVRLDARWIDIDSDVKLNGTKIGEVHIDPVVVGLAYVMRF